MKHTQTDSAGRWLVSYLVLATAIMPFPLGKYLYAALFEAINGQWMELDMVEFGLAAAVCFALVAWRLPMRRWPWMELVPWALFAIWVLIDIRWSVFPRYSRRAWFSDALMPGATFLLGYTVIVTRWLTEREWSWVLKGVLGIIVLWYVAPWFGWREGGVDQVYFGTWMAYCVPPLLWLSASRREGPQARSVMVALVLMLLMMWFVYSRMLWLTLLLLTFVTGLSYRFLNCEPTDRKQWRQLLWAIALIAVAGYFYTSILKPASAMPGAELPAGEGWWRVFISSERYAIFKFWFAQGMQSPWVGVGYGWKLPGMQYAHNMPKGFLPIFVSHGHNLFMNQWLQLGVIGLGLFAAWLMALASRAWGALRSEAQPTRRIGILLMTLLLVLLLKNLPDDGMRGGNTAFYWFLAGLGVGVARLGTQFAKPDSGTTKVTTMKRTNGFTLIELMIVIAIIGILAAIAVPNYVSFIVRGNNKTAQSDTRNVLTQAIANSNS